jgi:hypothetical protein
LRKNLGYGCGFGPQIFMSHGRTSHKRSEHRAGQKYKRNTVADSDPIRPSGENISRAYILPIHSLDSAYSIDVKEHGSGTDHHLCARIGD